MAKLQSLQKLKQKYLCGEAGHTIIEMCTRQVTKRQSVCAKQTSESWWMQLGVRFTSRR